jgi:pyrroloquinoline-quinone synthase
MPALECAQFAEPAWWMRRQGRSITNRGIRMPNVNETVTSLDALGAEMSLLKHPFYQEWTAGTLSAQRLRNYAIQYYPHIAAFPRYLSALHSRCADLETRQVLLENLIDEERGAENHPELWLRFAQALGLTQEEVLAAAPLPTANALVATFDRLSRDLPLSAGLSALYVYESQVAEVASAKIDGLKRFYGIADDGDNAKADGAKFFTVHRDADPYHAQAVAQLIERNDTHSEDRAIALRAGRAALKAVWDLLDSV